MENNTTYENKVPVISIITLALMIIYFSYLYIDHKNTDYDEVLNAYIFSDKVRDYQIPNAEFVIMDNKIGSKHLKSSSQLIIFNKKITINGDNYTNNIINDSGEIVRSYLSNEMPVIVRYDNGIVAYIDDNELTIINGDIVTYKNLKD